jgi:hypothetical protein
MKTSSNLQIKKKLEDKVEEFYLENRAKRPRDGK